MQNIWQKRNAWLQDPVAALEEADRRIAMCRENRGEILYLGDVKIDRLPAGIESLTWLRELNLYGSPLTDLDALAPLVNLEQFLAGSLHSRSPQLDFMADWQSLRRFELIATTTLDLSPLATCTNLKHLSIKCSQHPVDLLNLEALGRLKLISHLSLNNMRSDHFEAIGEWSDLTFIQLIETNLDDLAAFSRLGEIDHLDLHGSPISDLSPMANLPRLRSLKVAKTAISDLTPVALMPSLDELNVSCTLIADLRPLANLNLRSIDLSGCPVANISSLSDCANLQRIDLSDTHISSVEALHGLNQLESLRLARTNVRKLGPLGAFSRLQFLAAAESNIEGLAALAPGHSLQGIDISNTPVVDLSPLREAKSCRSLNLRGSMVSDLSPIIETGSREEDHRYSPQVLDFRDTPAAKGNDRLAELAAIAESDKHRCFIETKDYLRAQTVEPKAKRAGFLRRLLG